MPQDDRTQADEVILEWFGELHPDGTASPEKVRRWFIKDPAFDALLRQRFGALVEQALNGQLADWADSARGRLALILLLDQFTRNIYRDSPNMYAGDQAAVELAKAGINNGQADELAAQMRCFVYMPLMHSEQLADQEQCVACFAHLKEHCPQALRDGLANNHKYAIAHRDIVAQFGRFPHRNSILGRDSSPQELEFLKQPGSSF